MTLSEPVDLQEFRSALGSFATGVTVVTTATDDQIPVGVTASSFNSVSLDPPLVLWSLAKKSMSLGAFRDSGHFAVHILSFAQEDLSNSFAKSGADKFGNVDWRPGQLGSPILGEFAAKFECRTLHQYEGGDHIIFVGEVVALEKRDHAPLVFHGGKYAEARPRIKPDAVPTVEPEEGRFTDDFFLYLLSRAHFQTSAVTRRKTEEFGLSQSDYLTITLLGMSAPLAETDICERLAHTGHAPSQDSIKSLLERKLIERHDNGLVLTATARTMFIETLSVSKAFEDDLLDNFPAGEIAEMKHVLKRIIQLTGNNIPELWN